VRPREYSSKVAKKVISKPKNEVKAAKKIIVVIKNKRPESKKIPKPPAKLNKNKKNFTKNNQKR